MRNFGIFGRVVMKISETKAQIFVMDQNGNLSIQNYSKIPVQTIISIPQTYQSKRKYQKNSSFLNTLTNCQELKKIIKLLKNGKSPGIDRNDKTFI